MEVDVAIFEKEKQIGMSGDADIAPNLPGNVWLIRQNISALGLCFSALNVRDRKCEKYQKMHAFTGKKECVTLLL